MHSLPSSRIPAAVALFGLLWCLPGRAANLIVNGEFLSGVAGWQTIGTVFDTGQTAVISDQGGSRVVLFQSVAVPLDTTATLSLSYDLFTALSPVVGLGQTPDTLFLTAFQGSVAFGNSFVGGIYETSLPLMDADFRGAANFAPGLTGSPSPKGAGWTRYQLALPVTGFVTVSFEFVDGNGVVGDSTTAVDNVVLDAVPVPEPGVAVVLAAIAGMPLGRRRRRTFST